MKRTLIILTPLLLTTLVFAGLLRYFHPEIENFFTQQIRELSSRFSPVEITAEHIQFHLLPPSIEIESIQIAAKNPESLGFDMIDIDTIEADLDYLQLLVGRIGISTLTVKSPETEINLDEIKSDSSAPQKGINLNPLFDQLKILPIHRLSIVNLDAKVFSKSLRFELLLDQSNALLVNTGNSIILESEFDAQELKYGNLKDSAHLRLGFVLYRNQIEVPQFHLTTLNTDILLSATIYNINNLRNNLTAHAHVNTTSDLKLLSEKISNEFKFPTLLGTLKLGSQIEFDAGVLKVGSLDLRGEGLNIDRIEIGKVDLSGNWKDNQFKSKIFQITNEASLIDLPMLELNFKWPESKPQMSFKTQVKTEMLDLNQLLQNLNLGKVPIELMAAAELQCGGPLYPDFSVTCQGDVHSDMFEARSGYEKGNVIVQLGEVNIAGTVNIDTERVQYKTDLKIGENTGHSEGRISYAEGFNISYDTPEVDFKNLENLANLKLEGKAKLSGRITGDQHHAVFFIDANGDNIWFENYYLGQPQLTVRYKNGLLSFDNIKSNINGSNVSANVEVNLHENQILIDGESQKFDVTDALAAFQRKITLPIEVGGTGNVKVHAAGPLDFSHLSYDFSTNLEKGTIAGESFESAVFKVHSQNGEVKIEDFHLLKGQGRLDGQGTAHPNGTTQLSIETQNMALEESENVARLSPNISGLWYAKMQMSGKILNPEIQLDANLKNLVIEDQEFPPSQAQFQINSHTIAGTSNLFDGKLKSNFILPFTEQDPFKFEASARDWNYTTIFTLIGGGTLLSEYQASLTGDLNLHAEKGGVFASSGEGSILKATLQRKNLRLINPGPMELKMDKGQLTLKNFRMAGDDSYIEVSSNGSTKNNLNLKARGNIQLHILQIFVPFIDELSGIANVQTSINGTLDKPEILGTGTLDNGFIKLKALPHVFERVSAKAQFSQSKIIITDIAGSLAGGTLGGEGTISILGLKNLPMLFKGHFENVNLNIPDRIRSTGSGEIILSGNWFPFTLAGTYHVTGGLITKEFNDSISDQIAKQSSYLPRILLQSAFEPIQLNLQVFLDQPITIKNSMIEGALSGNVGIQGTPSSPILAGKISIEHNSKISFRDKNFDVSSGVITFNNPKELNPELFIAGQSHVSDYDINLVVQGTAKAPIIRLDSIPPLPYQDIVSLLALGITTGNLDDTRGTQRRDTQIAATQAIVAGVNELSKSAQKAWNVDFTVTSQYDDTKNMAVQRYTISRKIYDGVTLYGTQTKGDLDSQFFQLKYKLNSNVSLSTSYEIVESAQSGTSTQIQPTGRVFGIDLEFKQEFK